MMNREAERLAAQERKAFREALSDPEIVGFNEQERYENMRLLFEDYPHVLHSVKLSGAPAIFAGEVVMRVKALFSDTDREKELIDAFLSKRAKSISGSLPSAPTNVDAVAQDLDGKLDEVIAAARTLPDAERSKFLASVMTKIGSELS